MVLLLVFGAVCALAACTTNPIYDGGIVWQFWGLGYDHHPDEHS